MIEMVTFLLVFGGKHPSRALVNKRFGFRCTSARIHEFRLEN